MPNSRLRLLPEAPTRAARSSGIAEYQPRHDTCDVRPHPSPKEVDDEAPGGSRQHDQPRHRNRGPRTLLRPRRLGVRRRGADREHRGASAAALRAGRRPRACLRHRRAVRRGEHPGATSAAQGALRAEVQLHRPRDAGATDSGSASYEVRFVGNGAARRWRAAYPARSRQPTTSAEASSGCTSIRWAGTTRRPAVRARGRLSRARRPSPENGRGGERGDDRAGQPERHVAERVLVRRVQLGGVADEREVLPELPQHRGHAARADDERERLDAREPEAQHELPEGERQERPVDEVVEVVPPLDRVVEVEGVADACPRGTARRRGCRARTGTASAVPRATSRAGRRRPRSSSRAAASRTPCPRTARARRRRRARAGRRARP